MPTTKGTLLIACSARKRAVRGAVPARLLYTGTLFKLSLKYARLLGLKPVILSAKYGFIDADQLISHYDKKMETPYDGKFPKGKGFFIGGSLYFGNAPTRFKRVIPEKLGLLSQIKWLKKEVNRLINLQSMTWERLIDD